MFGDRSQCSPYPSLGEVGRERGARRVELGQHCPAGPVELIVAFGDLLLKSFGEVSPPSPPHPALKRGRSAGRFAGGLAVLARSAGPLL